MISFCQFGAGCIRAIYADSIARHPDAGLHVMVDVDSFAAEKLARRHGRKVETQASVLADPSVDAVLIDTHADLVEAAARTVKAIFCEKPLDLDRRHAEACLAVAAECGASLMLGFNRCFDPDFAHALTLGAPPLPGGSDGVKALALADAAPESSRTGRAVAL
jgi:myo-inositol 2-dehydrogenase/D-chiro-inositol 1-dehydrogenase